MENDYIRNALEQYNMQNAEFRLIRHNENMTLKVDEKYLLRIHKHIEGFNTDVYYEGMDRMAIRRSELAFLSHLNRRGIRAQLPVPNKKGDLLTILPDGVCVTMLTWIPGRNLEKSDVSENICFQIGAMIAKMHAAAVNFRSKEILQYDSNLCERIEKELELEKALRVLGKAYIEVIQAACRVMRDRLSSNTNITTVHADLSLSNILITDSELIPIDFSFFGSAHPMMDISSLYSCVNGVEYRRAIAEGYQSLGGKIDFPMLDVCYALNLLLYIVLHINGASEQPSFMERIERWCREIFQPLANGKRLINEEFYMLNVKTD